MLDAFTARQLVAFNLDIPVPTGNGNEEDLSAVSTRNTAYGEYAITRYGPGGDMEPGFHAEFTAPGGDTEILAQRESFSGAKDCLVGHLASRLLADPATRVQGGEIDGFVTRKLQPSFESGVM